MIRSIARRLALAAACASLVALAACGDDEPSAQEQYCQAGEDLRTSVDELLSVDLIAGGTDGLQSAIDDVQTSLNELRDTGSDAAAGEIDELDASFEQLQSAVGDLGGELSTDNASNVVAAIQGVGDSAQAVYRTLTDC